ncbi:PAS-domain containing protein [Defluviimonas sp. SAOS-178_SWC]|uniref:PAS-domain containing protein n=1 Tax=Defluviimonas sp. SAOS-178_SWC TaxID=3121287 RepID=UPI0032214740
MVTPLMLSAVVVTTSIAAALVALLLLSAVPQRRGTKADLPQLSAPFEQAIFLFDDRELVDATSTGRALLGAIPGPGSEWSRLAGYLSLRLRGFEAEMSSLAERGELEMRGQDDDGFRVKAEWLGQMARLTVSDLSVEGQGILVDGLSQRAQEAELASLRETVATAPFPVWRTDGDNTIVWANHAYLDRVAERQDGEEDDMTWPVPALFLDCGRNPIGKSLRKKLSSPDGGAGHWYDCYSYPAAEGQLHFALPADTVVKAETSLREFVQTLTKTFAHLPIGLAIFDRQRQLALFNPALVDLTSAGAEFLSARPTLFAFLDRLREAHVIPEPKDYGSWRQQMLDLEKAAASGLYEETWTLPSGQTYHVTGRPHPDGAVAFLIEDITAEIALTRRFRSEIELGQSVVDTLDEAIAVFSPAGELILSNSAYEDLWGVEPGRTLGTMTIMDSLKHWQEQTRPNPTLGDIRDFVTTLDERAEWTAELPLTAGGALSCRIVPLLGGATLVGFERVAPDRPLVRRIRRNRYATAPGSQGETVQA